MNDARQTLRSRPGVLGVWRGTRLLASAAFGGALLVGLTACAIDRPTRPDDAAAGFRLALGIAANIVAAPGATLVGVVSFTPPGSVAVELARDSVVIAAVGADAPLVLSPDVTACRRAAGRSFSCTLSLRLTLRREGAVLDESQLSFSVPPGAEAVTVPSVTLYEVAALTVLRDGNLPVTSAPVLVSSGTTLALSATIRDAANRPVAGRPVAWTSANPSIASVSMAGVVTGILPGTTTIVATSGGRTAVVTITVAPPPVTISITPPTSTLDVGNSFTFSVQIGGGSPTTPPTLASCTSSIPAVAVVAVQGSACRVTAIAPGSVTISATASTGQSAAASLTVLSLRDALIDVTLRASGDGVVVGQTLSLTPTPTRASPSVTVSYMYASSDPSIATVNATTGLVTGIAPGTATITVTATGSGAGFTTSQRTAQASVTVTPAPDALTSVALSPGSGSVAVGQTLSLTPTPTRASPFVTVTYFYASSNPSIATVNTTTGLVTGIAPGTATITVTATGSGAGFTTSQRTAQASVTVTPTAALTSVTLSASSDSVRVGQTLSLIPTPIRASPSVTVTYVYASSNPIIAMVNTSTGVVTGITPGIVTITVTATGSGAGFVTSQRTAQRSIRVTPQ